MKKSGFLPIFAMFLLLGSGCSSASVSNVAQTFADCADKEYTTLRNFEDDKACADLVEEQIMQECDKDQYISRQERVQRLSRAACQEAVAISSERGAQEADLKGMTLKELIESKLGDETLLEGNIITEMAAVEEVKNSNIFQKLLSSYPELSEKAEFYTTRETKKLAESDLWFPITRSIEQFDQENLNEPVWQVLITCLDDCDEFAFFTALHDYIPTNMDEGMNESSSDLIFVVHARTGDIIMYERGSGQRGDALAFMTQWLEFSE